MSQKTSSQKLLDYLEILESSAFSGEVIISTSDGASKICFDKGLVLWAHAKGQSITFQSILHIEHGLDRKNLAESLKSAKKENLSQLSDLLEYLGIKDFSTRARIIERHSAAAFREILKWELSKAYQYPKKVNKSENTPHFSIASLLEAEEELLKVETKDTDSIKSVLDSLRALHHELLAVILIDRDTGMVIASSSSIEDLSKINMASAIVPSLLNCSDELVENLISKDSLFSPLQELSIHTADGELIIEVLSKHSSMALIGVSDPRGIENQSLRESLRRSTHSIIEII